MRRSPFLEAAPVLECDIVVVWRKHVNLVDNERRNVRGIHQFVDNVGSFE